MKEKSENKFIASPLNFTGGKYKLLPQILPLFPKNINVFYDIFCGGCNVGVNIQAKKIICNDANSKIIGLMNYFKSSDYKSLKQKIDGIISSYNLSNSSKNGYEFYGCESFSGLGSFNKEKFLKLRDNFNKMKKNDSDYFLFLYVLIVYSFNNQIRFNDEEKFNLPVGKRDFNFRMQKKLERFINGIKKINFTNKSFEKFSPEKMTKNDFIYCDPPYLITCAPYNEKNGWNETQEKKLLDFLDEADDAKIKFALSNALFSNGKENAILSGWIKSRKNYVCHHLEYSYKNSSYHKKNGAAKTDEVLVTNY